MSRLSLGLTLKYNARSDPKAEVKSPHCVLMVRSCVTVRAASEAVRLELGDVETAICRLDA